MQEQINQQLPEGWKIVRLGDFVEKEKGKKPKNESLHKSDEFPLPYIDIQAFEEGIIKSWTDGLGCRLCSEDDLLMVWDGSRSGLVGKGVNGALGSTLMRISFSNIYNPYAFYFLQSKYQEINTRAKGSGTPHVDPDLLWKYEFPIAPLEQQKKIVEKIEELFSELDSGIASLKTTQEQLKIYRQSLLKHAFEGKLTEQWRKDNPDKLENPEQLLARIQQEREARYQQQLKGWEQAVKEWSETGKEGKRPPKPRRQERSDAIGSSNLTGNIPLAWQLEPLGNVFSVFVGATPSRKQPGYWSGDINWVSSGEVAFCNITSTKEKITRQGYENTSTEIHPVGTVLLAMIGEGKTRGQAAVLKTQLHTIKIPLR